MKRNQEEMEQMKKSWEGRLKEEQRASQVTWTMFIVTVLNFM